MGTTTSQETSEKTVKSSSIKKGFRSPRYIKLSGNVKRSKFAITFGVFFEALSVLLIGLLSVFRITTSDTFSLLALFNLPHFCLAFYAFFVARPFTFDVRVFTTFVSTSFILLLLDLASVIWRHILVQDCIDDPTPSNDCENHIVFSWIIIGLNYVLIGVATMYFITGVIISVFSKPLMDQAKLLANTYETAWISGSLQQQQQQQLQPVQVQILQDKDGKIQVKSPQGTIATQRFTASEPSNLVQEEDNSQYTTTSQLNVKNHNNNTGKKTVFFFEQ